VRPAVIEPDAIPILDEFRRFHHLVRNVYTMNLAPEKILDFEQTVSATGTLKRFAVWLGYEKQSHSTPPRTGPVGHATGRGAR
jgi:hypothetical protein